MSEFKEMIVQALMGEEPYQPDVGRDALERSVRKFERRERTARYLGWFAVTFGTILFASGAYLLWRADESTSTKMLIVYAVLVFFGGSQIAFTPVRDGEPRVPAGQTRLDCPRPHAIELRLWARGNKGHN